MRRKNISMTDWEIKTHMITKTEKYFTWFLVMKVYGTPSKLMVNLSKKSFKIPTSSTSVS
ncbi:MAG: hypothetical protein K2L45_12960 [Muribaculaceae bacterium]|nr:hypothetical protein [Muribaculaceae bacterium]